jgi:hypothetical protein
MRLALFWFLMTVGGGCRSGEERAANNIAHQSAATEAERVVQGVVDAFNSHDLERTVAGFAPDVQGYLFPDSLLTNSREKVRGHFQKTFVDEPNVHVTISPRIVHGPFVIDHEVITGLKNGKTDSALWIYEVTRGHIVRAWVFPDY